MTSHRDRPRTDSLNLGSSSNLRRAVSWARFRSNARPAFPSRLSHRLWQLLQCQRGSAPPAVQQPPKTIRFSSTARLSVSVKIGRPKKIPATSAEPQCGQVGRSVVGVFPIALLPVVAPQPLSSFSVPASPCRRSSRACAQGSLTLPGKYTPPALRRRT